MATSTLLNIRHDYLIEMVKRHTSEQWIILYIERWLKTPFKMQDGTIVERKAGTPQGRSNKSSISKFISTLCI